MMKGKRMKLTFKDTSQFAHEVITAGEFSPEDAAIWAGKLRDRYSAAAFASMLERVAYLVAVHTWPVESLDVRDELARRRSALLGLRADFLRQQRQHRQRRRVKQLDGVEGDQSSNPIVHDI
jgi:hypothetical protein